MRKFISVPGASADFEAKLLAFAAQREVACVLRSNRNLFHTTDRYSRFEWCVALDAIQDIRPGASAFESLRAFHEEKKDWLFGFLTYDVKNEIENLKSDNHDGLGFPVVHFFQPKYLFLMDENGLRLGIWEDSEDLSNVQQLIADIQSVPVNEDGEMNIDVIARVSRADYLKNIAEIKKHIQRGDIYEMNYCVEFFSPNVSLSMPAIYEKLTGISPMPFSCFYKWDNLELACASPERFIAKRGKTIISQPIKGTARRGSTRLEDESLVSGLKNDEKERSENVMIVDLVRNDLSRTAAKGTVRVEELFGIYSFTQLHQMISTVVSEIGDGIHWTEVIRNAFPMGSMTGAPKISAMQLIEAFETTKRGLYSGTVGYVTPEGDFDFNVVIRSILYNTAEKYLSFMVGSAITINADAEKEYGECLLKADSMMQVLLREKREKVS